MPILTIPVENPDQLLNASMFGAGALGRVERSATGGGSGFTEIATFAIVAGTRTYTVYDLAGAAASFYRVRYSKSDGSSPSAYGDEFQAGAEEQAGYLCSLYDVKQRLGHPASATNDDEILLELIRSVSTAIEGYTGRWLAPRPLSGTTTYRIHTCNSRRLAIPKGVRSITTLGVATEDQPASGGTYTTATSTAYVIDPPEMERDYGWPGTSIVFRNNATGAVVNFYEALYGAEITGAFGFASVPADISDIAANAVIRKFIGKERAEPQAFVGPAGGVTLLRDISPADMGRLEWYRHWEVG